MNRKIKTTISVICLTVIISVYACQKPVEHNPGPIPPPADNAPNLPAVPYNYTAQGFMPAHIRNFLHAHPDIDNTPANNPITNDGATLGRVLFYDKSLSINNKIACASCHHQDKAFTDGTSTSKGFNDQHTRRNAMPIINLRYFKGKKMFWDLRSASLEDQVLHPITDPVEMGMPSIAALEARLKNASFYPELFRKAFGTTNITGDRIARALSQFLRSITSFNSKYDQGLENNFASFTPQEIRGKQLVAQLNCIECHSDLSNVRLPGNPDPKPTFLLVENTGENIFNVGINNGLEHNYSDNGIGEKTGRAKDMATFKMPSLRNIELTAPYMHDGRFATLEQVIDHYNNGVKNHPNLGIQIPPGGYNMLTTQDKAAIVAFLKTLTDKSLATDQRFSDPFRN